MSSLGYPGHTRMRDRPTADLIVIFLAFVVGTILLVTTMAVIFLAVFEPQADASEVIQRIGTIVANLAGAIVGYIAGRGVNEGTTEPPEEDKKTTEK